MFLFLTLKLLIQLERGAAKLKAFISHKCSLGCGLSLSMFPSLQREVFLWVFLVYFSSLKQEKPVADQGEGGGEPLFVDHTGV